MRQFFEGAGGVLSMSRLLLFMSFFPASWVVTEEGSPESLGIYLAAYAGLAMNNKWAERKNDPNMDTDKLADGSLRSDSALSDSANMESGQLARKSRPTERRKSRAF